jgi:hypothetical protein
MMLNILQNYYATDKVINMKKIAISNKKTRKNIHALNYIVKKYGIDPKDGSPIEIPNTDRITLAYLFKELGFKKGVEVGVHEGIYSEVLLQANPKLKLYGVYPWTFYETAGDSRKKEQFEAFYKTAVKRLAPYKKCTIIKKANMKAVKDFEDKSLDFVYIDANPEYSHVFQDIVEWSKKIKKGGIISGHNYRRSKYKNTELQVVFAVNDYVREYKIKHWFILGRKEIIEGEKRDKFRSWFWIK